MEIEIRGYLGASALLQSEPGKWDVLVILDSGLSPYSELDQLAHQNLVLWFDDIEYPTAGKSVATEEQISSAFGFAKESCHLLVTCRAGQSRSVALATLIAADRMGVDFAIGQVLDPARHRPNGLVIDLGCRILDRPEIYPKLKEWTQRNGGPLESELFQREIDTLTRERVRNVIVGSTTQP